MQILTTGSLVHALSDVCGVVGLLESDAAPTSVGTSNNNNGSSGLYATFTLPLSLAVSRAIHANLLGAPMEVKMLLQNTVDDGSVHGNGILSLLLYREGKHPLLSCLSAAPDDEFLDSRSTWHKRLPHICWGLQYIVEMPGTGWRLLSHPACSTCNAAAVGVGVEDAMAAAYENFFPAVWAWLLQMGQASGGHVRYENCE